MTFKNLNPFPLTADDARHQVIEAPRSFRGYSIIETLIVMALIGVLSALAVPQLISERRLTRSVGAPAKKQRRACAHSGFSILELLIVTSMITVITGYAVIQVARALELQRLDAAAAMVVSKLGEARMNAIKRNSRVVLTLDPAAQAAQIQMENPPASGTYVNVGTPGMLPQGITFGNTATVRLTFDSLGRSAHVGVETVTLRLARTVQQKTVMLAPTGGVTVGAMSSYSP